MFQIKGEFTGSNLEHFKKEEEKKKENKEK